MIADKRADALVSNFTGQWLQLRNLESKVRPDILTFPDFDDNIREAFRRETELLFSHILRENRSALELLSADYTFVNERLARHYGIPGVYGTRFRKVTVTDPNRRGLLGHGSILSLTSVATRTSPVFRGKFVLSDVPEHAAAAAAAERADARGEHEGRGDAPKTVREQLERAPQRARPAPAAIASSTRPGFALENFNSVGQWRTRTSTARAIDTGGVLADGTKVDGPVGACGTRSSSRPDAFATVLTERLMTYALGRGVEPSDMPVVRRIVKNAAQRNYRARSRSSAGSSTARRSRCARSWNRSRRRHTWCAGSDVEQTVVPTVRSVRGAAMIITKKHLSRRTFLRGTFGAAVALPFLDAMVPALASAARRAGAVPVRRHLHAVRRVSRHVASGADRQATSSSSR